ncbi:MAG TPA: hypothetical protein HA252_01890 [Candidatus Diapherotrites archaeon]|uniref:Uncharacterized protein n=1 Tax=Candidatus Iainarchaeum sp. TaxID=3101447 RepID=A0A7J4JIA2_9ARCH|nr:hypothetical protein [Candidatus Diapherotrites archaeon]HIH16135.1 hypothetical protein [Candidatus Diapherotrites archaeon]
MTATATRPSPAARATVRARGTGRARPHGQPSGAHGAHQYWEPHTPEEIHLASEWKELTREEHKLAHELDRLAADQPAALQAFEARKNLTMGIRRNPVTGEMERVAPIKFMLQDEPGSYGGSYQYGITNKEFEAAWRQLRRMSPTDPRRAELIKRVYDLNVRAQRQAMAGEMQNLPPEVRRNMRLTAWKNRFMYLTGVRSLLKLPETILDRLHLKSVPFIGKPLYNLLTFPSRWLNKVTGMAPLSMEEAFGGKWQGQFGLRSPGYLAPSYQDTDAMRYLGISDEQARRKMEIAERKRRILEQDPRMAHVAMGSEH